MQQDIMTPQTRIFLNISKKSILTYLLATLTCFIFFWLVMQKSPYHDIVWQFWIARQMEAGTGLYSEIVELNPPLWFWMAYVCQKIATFLGVEATTVYKLSIISIVCIIGLTLPNLLGFKKHSDRIIFFLASVFLLCVQPIYNFGQREHLLVILALPYILLVAQRIHGKKISPSHAALIGTVAAFGFALKHYFILVPIFLEIWVLYKSRKITSVFRPETIMLGIMAIIYVIAIATLTPTFLSEIVPLTKLTYDGYKAPFIYTLIRSHIVLWIFAGITLACLLKSTNFPKNHNITALMIACCGYALSYFLQHKGWLYHALPVSTTLLFMIVYILMRKGLSNIEGPLKTLLISLLILSVTPTFLIQNLKKTYDSQLTPYISNQPALTPVLILATNPSLMWPQVENENTAWVSRYFATWMMPKIVYTEQKTNTLPLELEQLADSIRKNMLEDIQCNPPTVIASIRDTMTFQRQPTNKTILEFLGQNPEWQSFFTANYIKTAETEDFDIYTPTAPIKPLTHPNCRVIY